MNSYHLERWGEGLFEIGRQRSRGWNNVGRSWEENFIFCGLPETSKIEAV